MPDNSFKILELHKCDRHESDTPLDWGRSAQLRDQLVSEICALEEQMTSLEESKSEIDFSSCSSVARRIALLRHA